MKLTELMKELNIGKWSACWAFISDGWAGIIILVACGITQMSSIGKMIVSLQS